MSEVPQKNPKPDIPTNPRDMGAYMSLLKWKSLPSHLLAMGEDKLRGLGFDEMTIDLMSITTQREFADKHGLGEDTISHWTKMERFQKDLTAEIKSSVYNTYQAAMAHGFTMKALKYGDSRRVELWYKMFGDLVDEEASTIVNGNVTINQVADHDNIRQLVLSKVAQKTGKPITELMSQIMIGQNGKGNGHVEDVEFQELPSNKQYDFDAIDKKHSNGDESEPQVKYKQADNGEPAEDLKERIKRKIEESKESLSSDDVQKAIDRVKKKGKDKNKGDDNVG